MMTLGKRNSCLRNSKESVSSLVPCDYEGQSQGRDSRSSYIPSRRLDSILDKTERSLSSLRVRDRSKDGNRRSNGMNSDNIANKSRSVPIPTRSQKNRFVSEGDENPEAWVRLGSSWESGGDSPRTGSPLESRRDLDGCDENCFQQMSIKVYTEEKSYRTVPIDESTTVAEVREQLIQKSLVINDPAWSIVEHLGKYKIERSLEEHEIIYDLYKLWLPGHDNKFYLRKDFNKYELFRNPNQYFPESMIDVTLPTDDFCGLLSRYERYKNLLLQNLLSDECIPDIQGYMHIKEHKRSWKKHFCILRKSGLYYSLKADNKEPRHLVLISPLDDVEVFSAPHAKKSLGAPTSHAFALKYSSMSADAKSLKLFSCDNEQAKMCWITGIRFTKYGWRLRENFKLVLKCDECLVDDENKTNHNSENGLNIHERVAMDFSGERGRVVADPKEALSVAFEEGHAWRVKAARLPAGSPPVRDSVDGSSLSDGLSRSSPVTSAHLHMVQPWFHCGTTREEAQTLIEQHGLADGVFLLRDSQSMPGVSVLSFAHNAKVKHCTINKMEYNGQLFYSLDGGVTKFMDLIQLVDFYQLNAGALPTHLTHYVTRLL